MHLSGTKHAGRTAVCNCTRTVIIKKGSAATVSAGKFSEGMSYMECPKLFNVVKSIPIHSFTQSVSTTHSCLAHFLFCITKAAVYRIVRLHKDKRHKSVHVCCYLGIVRPCAIIPLSLRCRSSLSSVSRISLSTAVSGSSRGLRYDESSRPESSELGDIVEDSGGSLGTGGWISLREDGGGLSLK